MKKILIFCSFLLSVVALQAQDTLCYVVVNQVQGGFCLQATAYGTAPFSYYWSNGDTGNTICPNDTINSYCVTVIDADSCVSTACGILSSPTNCSVSIVADLLGAPIPNLTAVTTGFGNYNFQWNTGETTSTIIPDQSGDYCVTIWDSLGCQASACYYWQGNTPDSCSVYISEVQNGMWLQAYASGVGPYVYQWTTGETTSGIMPTQSGNYCVTIWDTIGCQANACYYWQGNGQDSCDVSISIDSIGGLTANAIGTAPFSYYWDGNQTGQTIYPLNAGTYCVSVVDAAGCVSASCAYWQGNTPDSCSVYISEVQNGMWLQAYASGVGPYSYQWTTGETTSGIMPTQSGDYCVTIWDTIGCQASACYYWQGNGQDSCDVSISIDSITGLTANAIGTAPFIYYWDGIQTGPTIYPLNTGTYCVSVVDATGCVSTSCAYWQNSLDSCSVSIDEVQNGMWLQASTSGVGPYSYQWNTGETTSSIMPTQSGDYCVTIWNSIGCQASACYYWLGNGQDSCDVSISIDSIGGLTANAIGTAPFSYYWGGNQTDQTIYPLNAGTYCVSVVDATGCVSASCVYWPGNTLDSCSVYISEVQNGMWLQAYASGVGPYSYQWNTGETTSGIMPTQSGDYCVTIWDTIGCQASACYYWQGNGQDSCDLSISVDPNIGLTANATGTAPFSYYWDGNQTDQTIYPLSAGTYCVSVVDATGCVSAGCAYWSPDGADSCSVTINEVQNGMWLQASASGVGPYSYQWTTGATTSGIMPTQSGNYCVTIWDTIGCQATACYYWQGNTPDSCYASINNSGTGNLSVTASGTYPYTYLWSTGETTPSIQVNQIGQYCVTVIDSLGCQASDCIDWIPSCSATIYHSGDFGNVDSLYAVGSGFGPYTYLWSDGSTTQAIVVDTSLGFNYCVEITDALGCVAIACYDLSSGFNSLDDIHVIINGLSSIDSTNNSNFYFDIYLIQYDSVTGSLSAIDTVTKFANPNQNVSHTFENLPVGSYLVKAALNPNSNSYDHYLPTYYGDVLFWNDATAIQIPHSFGTSYSINLIQGNNLGGPGFIGGLVSEGANLTGGATPRGEGDPIENASILLLDENDQPIAYAYTLADGSYSFEGLPWGTYKVYIEILGLEPVFTWVTIGPDNETVDDVVFVVNSTSIEVVVTSIEELVEEQSVLLFPNPVSAEVYLEFTAKTNTEALLWISNVHGQRVMAKPVDILEGSQYLRFDVSALPQGMYFLNLTIKGENITKKMIKN